MAELNFVYENKDYSAISKVRVTECDQRVTLSLVNSLYKKAFQRTTPSEVIFNLKQSLPQDQFPAITSLGGHLTLMNSFFKDIVNNEFVFSTLPKNSKYEVLTKLWIFHLVSANLISPDSIFNSEWIPNQTNDKYSKLESVSLMLKWASQLLSTCNSLAFDETEVQVICVLIILEHFRSYSQCFELKFDLMKLKRILMNYLMQTNQSTADLRLAQIERFAQIERVVQDDFSDCRSDIYNAFLVPTPNYRYRLLPVPPPLRIVSSSPNSLNQSRNFLRHLNPDA